MIRVVNKVVVLAWLIALAASATAEPKTARGLKFKIGVYDPQGSSESSRFRPSRKPVQQDRETIELFRPPPAAKSPPPPPSLPPPVVPSPPPPPPPEPKPEPRPQPTPEPEAEPEPIPEQPDLPPSDNLLPRGAMCSPSRIKDNRYVAGNHIGNNFYNACKHVVGSVEECCSMCQNQAQCTGFVYERADCSGFGGPTNTGICLQIRDSVVSYSTAGSFSGSLNPFAQ